MSDREMEEMKKLLKEALPPMRDAEFGRNLWPAMLQRLAAPPPRVPWWDWVLLAGASATILFVPGVIPALLYHL
jgi:anti-sigma factor RsiW